ncbi:hypothetical protein OHS18_47200 [Amycolatopsis sp. NBC_00355]|uniref:hypothetical protein n=1 Tax=Amycolatopsis sp. NBC_00355 TaxID=2975957 RepID=UPI002E26439B
MGLSDDERGHAECGDHQADAREPPPAGPDPVAEQDGGSVLAVRALLLRPGAAKPGAIATSLVTSAPGPVPPTGCSFRRAATVGLAHRGGKERAPFDQGTEDPG